MDPEVKSFHIHLVTTTYGEAVPSAGRADSWTVVLPMIRVIWKFFEEGTGGFRNDVWLGG